MKQKTLNKTSSSLTLIFELIIIALNNAIAIQIALVITIFIIEMSTSIFEEDK